MKKEENLEKTLKIDLTLKIAFEIQNSSPSFQNFRLRRFKKMALNFDF